MSNSLLINSGPDRSYVMAVTLAALCVIALLLPSSAQAHTGPAGASISHWFNYGPTALEQCVVHRDSGGNPLCSYSCPWFAGDNVTSGYSLLESCLWSGQYQIASFIYPDKPCRSGQSFIEPGTCSGTDDGVPNPEKNLGCPSHKGDVENGKKGNPCDAATGNKFQTETDFTGGQGVPVVRRHYNSGLASLGLVSHQLTMGRGWTGMHLPRFETNGSLASVTQLTMRRADGKGIPFYRISGGWETDADLGMRLTEGGGATLTLTLRDGTVERYGSSGNISSITDPTGLTTTFTPSGLVNIAITGPFGHRLMFGYSSGRIATVTDSDQKTISYNYDADNNLSRVDYPDSTARIYHYENLSYPNFLTGISYASINPDGSLSNISRYSTYEYNSVGKAISTRHAETDNGAPQEEFTFNYNNYYTSSETTVTSAPGSTTAVPDVMTFAATLGVQNLVSKVNSIDGKSLNQTFDSSGNLICKKDEENRVTLYSYNSTNQRASMTEGLSGTDCNTCLANPANCNVGGVGRVTTYDYLSPTLDLPRFIRRPSVATGQTFETEIQYGDAGHPNLPTQIIQRGFTPSNASVSRTVTLGYNASGQVNSINGPRSPSDPGMNGFDDVTTLEYHTCSTGGKCGQLWKVANALGQVTKYPTYDANGRVTRRVEPNGAFTLFYYNPRGWLASELHYPNTSTPGINYTSYTSYSYTPSGQLASISKNPGLYGGLVLDFTYDAADDLRSVSESNYYSRWEYSYDLKGNRRQARALGGASTVVLSTDYTHDARNRLQTINSGGNLTQLVFDAVDNLTRETDPNNHATEHQYDALNRLFKTVNALTETATYGHDVNDHITQAQAPNGATTSLAYDDLGNLLQETSPDRGTTTYTYDNAGNVKTATDARGVNVTYTYDVLNRVSFVDYPGGAAQDVTFTYDAGPSCSFGLGRLCTHVDQSGTTQYGYDAFGNVTAQSRTYNGVTFTFQYAYDEWNRLTQVSFADGRKVNYGYDDLGHTIGASATVNGATTSVLSYRDYLTADLLTYQLFGNGIEDLRQYDLAGRLRTQSLGTADNRVYTYDGNGNLTQKQSLPETAIYAYDPLDQMTADALHSYSYLPNGNRGSDNGQLYVYASASNRLTAVNGQGYDYDAAGNLTNRNGYTYAYDKAGRLKQVNFRFLWWTYFNGSYLYDGFGRRAQKLDWNGVTTVFHYDPHGRLLAETTPQGALLRAYVWAEEVPVGQITKDPATGQETLVYLHTDHLNTPRLATNQQGAVVWRWEGGAFGETLPNEDPDGDGNLTTVNLRFSNGYWDSETGLFYGGARYWDPKTGRSITADPMSVAQHVARWRANMGRLNRPPLEINPYAYVLNNPLRWIDRFGFEAMWGGDPFLNESDVSPPPPPPYDNGNYSPGFEDQDNICSPAPWNPIEYLPCAKKCCRAHDACYKKYGCNASSWRGNFTANYGNLCQICNIEVMQCVVSNISNFDCSDEPCTK